jgi:hypothetical protein
VENYLENVIEEPKKGIASKILAKAVKGSFRNALLEN